MTFQPQGGARLILLCGLATTVALACADTKAIEPDRVVSLAIAGADTLTFGAVSSTKQLTATTTVSVGTPPPVRWRSTVPDVATVSDDGLVVSAGDGVTKIIAVAELAADTVTVLVHQLPVQLEFTMAPTHAAANIPFFSPVTVAIADSNRVPVRYGTDIVELRLDQNPSGASLIGTTTEHAVNGFAVFDSVAVDTPGSGYTLLAMTPALVFSSSAFDVQVNPDIIRFRNTGDQPVGSVLDGQSTRFLNDVANVTTDSMVMTVLTNALQGDEAVAFVEGRPPEVLTNPLWTDGVDTVDLVFRDPVTIAVTAWIVAGPFADLRARAINQSATTASVWAAERMGVEFAEFEIIDATGDPDASSLLNTTRCDQRSLAQSRIGFKIDRINLYYVGTVDNGRDRGYSCGDVIFMADRSGHELLVHEIGHSFGLGHIDGRAGYDETNVMHSASNVRQFLTEGQVFRQHVNESSALNIIYAIRPTGVRRCDDLTVTERCMDLITRLWGDGTFPPNR